MTAPAQFRPFTFGVTRAATREAAGATYLSADQALQPYAHRMTDRLVHWAKAAPDRSLYARREPAPGGPWKHLSFREALEAARNIGMVLSLVIVYLVLITVLRNVDQIGRAHV